VWWPIVTGQLFGFSLSALADLIVVGAPGDRNGTGAAYVFERRGGAWNQTAKLAASDAAPQRRFGNSVAATRNSIVVGALTNAHGTHPGAAYVFERRGSAWSEVTRLVRP
jgi:FG-GAP repeat protein